MALLAAVWIALPAAAVEPPDCKTIDAERERLECYDRAAGREVRRPPVPPRHRRAIIDELWPSVEDEDRQVVKLMGHQPNYLLGLRMSNRVNERPVSPVTGSVSAGDLSASEVKYQISIKTPLRRRLWDGRLELWLAYTQQSHWQILRDSGPFRETNYMPEAMARIHVDQALPGFVLRHVNVGVVHQSNGRAAAGSRSWNRLYAELGLEHGDDLALLVRPWLRLPDVESVDTNPDIQAYVGRADVTALYRWNDVALSFMVRSNLAANHARGAVQFDVYVPLYRQLKGYVQMFSGYGESLIDYNHRQTTLGIGVALLEWM